MNNSGAAHDLRLDREQFEARMNTLLESDREWDIELAGLQAHEVMTLFTVFAAGAEHFRDSDAPPEQLRLLGRMQDQIKADVPEIAEALDDMTDSAERAAEHAADDSPDGGIRSYIPETARAPFGRLGGEWTVGHTAWALGLGLVLMQAVVAFVNLAASLGGFEALSLSTLASLATGVGAAVLFAFALGYVAHGRREGTRENL